jgi:hypothetical protein
MWVLADVDMWSVVSIYYGMWLSYWRFGKNFPFQNMHSQNVHMDQFSKIVSETNRITQADTWYVHVGSTTDVCLPTPLLEFTIFMNGVRHIWVKWPYLPPVNFKRIQQQNYAIICGVYVCMLPIVTSVVDPISKYTGIYYIWLETSTGSISSHKV